MEKLLVSPFLMGVSAFSSIIGLLLSLLLIYLANQIDIKVKAILHAQHYNKHRKQYKNKLEGLIASISKDNIWDDDIFREITQQIRYYGNYNLFFSIPDRYYVFTTLSHLKKGKNKIVKEKLVHQLTYFISKYEMDK